MELVHEFLRLFTDLQGVLSEWVVNYQYGIYAILFVIIFCETGLVVTPFLPGDSLLFAAGTLVTSIPNSPLKLHWLILLLGLAASLGDATNFMIGRRVGPAVFTREDSFWLNKKHLLRAQRFYEKYGGKTIFLAHFVPIIRTFSPFVGGIGKMEYRRFALFNVTGVLTWVSLCTTSGVLFGGLPFVQEHFELVLVSIVVVSIMPAVIGYLRERKHAADGQQA